VCLIFAMCLVSGAHQRLFSPCGCGFAHKNKAHGELSISGSALRITDACLGDHAPPSCKLSSAAWRMAPRDGTAMVKAGERVIRSFVVVPWWCLPLQPRPPAPAVGCRSSAGEKENMALARAGRKTRNSLARSTRSLMARLELDSFYNEPARFITSQLVL